MTSLDKAQEHLSDVLSAFYDVKIYKDSNSEKAQQALESMRIDFENAFSAAQAAITAARHQS